MKKLKEAAKKVITQYIDPLDPLSIGWPPACTALLYQPERPVSTSPKDPKPIPEHEKE